MRTLELRLDDVQYETVNGWPQRRINLGTGEDARLSAALEFFDRALVQMGGGQAVVTPESEPEVDEAARAAFKMAAALTLLRFGVRIVGLESENSPQEAPEPTINPDPPRPTDRRPTASRSGAESAIRRDTDAIVEALFQSVLGGADRLVLMVDGPPQKDLGGWSRGGAAGLIAHTLRKVRAV